MIVLAMKFAALYAVVVVAASGCLLQDDITTPFPAGLDPVAENSAPEPGEPGEYPEDFSIVTGDGRVESGEDYVWVHMRGFVHADAADVWRFMQDPLVVSDRRNTDRQTVTYDVEPEYELSFEIHYVEERLLTVEWDEHWRYGTVEGSFEEPLHGAVRSQKVFGSDFIDFIETSMSVRWVDDGITEISMVEHLSALQEDGGVLSRYAQDVYENVLALSNGEELPSF